MKLGRYTLRRSRSYRTFLIEWDTDRARCIIGLTGMDRPSVAWHLTGWFKRRRLDQGKP